jgi:hypothetical protein
MRRIDVPKLDIVPAPGPAPMLQWIEIAQLVIDEAYQRDLGPRNWAAIRRIAEDFHWSRFSPVFCAPVEGGAFAIIDGQHRTHAAAMCGFKSVPCQVVQMSGDEQAQAFHTVNGAVTAVTIWNLFRAELAAGNPEAGALVAMAQAAGCSIATANAAAKNKKPGTIFFIQGIKALHAKHGDTLRQALAMVRGDEVFGDNVELWGGHILEPVLTALCERPRTIARRDFPSLLAEFDIFTVIDEIAEYRRRRLRGGLVVATGKELLRQKLIEFMDSRMPARVAA